MQSLGIKVLFQGINLQRLLEGLLVTARIALLSIVIGSLLGIVLGVIWTSRSRWLRGICRLYLEVFRIIPILVWLFIMYFGATAALNIDLSGETVAVIIFTLWGTAEMGDIVRGALVSLPKHQTESGKAIGLGFWGLYRYILIPQALRRMLPGAINLATRMVKTTSLVVLIGVIDVIKVGQQIIENSRNEVPSASFWVYGFVFILYFTICYPLSKLSRRLENKWSE
jgi:polar amino acid transport system permease protein